MADKIKQLPTFPPTQLWRHLSKPMLQVFGCRYFSCRYFFSWNPNSGSAASGTLQWLNYSHPSGQWNEEQREQWLSIYQLKYRFMDCNFQLVFCIIRSILIGLIVLFLANRFCSRCSLKPTLLNEEWMSGSKSSLSNKLLSVINFYKSLNLFAWIYSWWVFDPN